MHKQQGKIKSIESDKTGNYEKKIVELVIDDERSFIEFRNEIMKSKLKSFKVGDMVEILVFNSANVSKKSGIRYNNLIAKSIQHLDISRR